MPYLNHTLSAEIMKLLMDEAEARHGYEILLAEWAPKMTPEDLEVIKEIQEDEINHIYRLMAMARKYDGHLKASPDGMQETMQKLMEGM